MEWYRSSAVNEVVVPRDHGELNRFPSPNRWMQWGLNTGESFDDLEKSIDMQEKAVDNSGQDFEMDFLVSDKDQLEFSGVRGGISEFSNCWTTLMHDQDYQVDGFRGTNQTDENFVNSLLVDETPGSEFHSYVSSVSPGGFSAAGSLNGDMLIDLHDLGTSKHLEAERFPSALDWENMEAEAGYYNFTNMTNDGVPQFNAPLENDQIRSKHVCGNGDMGNMVSNEESVLHELDNVMQQMTDTTRLCFRDALYRLANDSGKQASIQSEGHCGKAVSNQKFRSEDKKKAPEARSNAIDRTVADLMFGNPCSSRRNQLHSSSTNLNQQGAFSAVKPHKTNIQSQHPISQMCFSTTTTSSRLGDAEVPTFMQGDHVDRQTTIRNMVQN